MNDKKEYQEPFLKIDDHILYLKGKGLIINNEEYLKNCLTNIGYSRLREYFEPFLAKGDCVTIKDHKDKNKNTGSIRKVSTPHFLYGTTFEKIMDLYLFDKELRNIIFDGIETIEISIKSHLVNNLGDKGIFSYRDTEEFNSDFSPNIKFSSRNSDHVYLLHRIDYEAKRDKSEIKKYRATYSSPLPIWLALKLFTFGNSKDFIINLKEKHINEICSYFSIPRRALLSTWINELHHIRNICAHHHRLWNLGISVQAKRVKRGEISCFDHLLENKNSFFRIYYSICMMVYMIEKITGNKIWKYKIKSHLMKMNSISIHDVNIKAMGFPDEWDNEAIWN